MEKRLAFQRLTRTILFPSLQAASASLDSPLRIALEMRQSLHSDSNVSLQGYHSHAFLDAPGQTQNGLKIATIYHCHLSISHTCMVNIIKDRERAGPPALPWFVRYGMSSWQTL